MKSTSILFSPPMVRAILSGTKTQTRRVIKPAPRNDQIFPRDWSAVVRYNEFAIYGDGLSWSAMREDGRLHDYRCPFGTTGDRLWVKEAIRRGLDGTSYYDADQTDTGADAWPWKLNYLPSMFCPQGLSRIALEIVRIRVERLNEISEDDARAEGAFATLPPDDSVRIGAVGTNTEGYRQIWESINGTGSWAANPLVWVLDFKRILPKEEPCHS